MMKFDPEKFVGKKAVILGAGKSGVACAGLLRKKGFDVLVSEKSKANKIGIRYNFLKKIVPDTTFEFGGHSKKVLSCDFAVKSPGIPANVPIIKKLKKARIPVFSELEVALAFCLKVEVFAVTGTNGKTTTTALLGEILREHYGKNKVFVAGNIGAPLSALVEKIKRRDIIVLEVSSFQLQDSNFFAPHICSVLNVTSDHIDYHHSMASYIKAKGKIFKYQSANDFSVFNADDKICIKLANRMKGRKLFFGARKTNKANAFFSDGTIIFKSKNKIFKVDPPSLPGAHNLGNAMAAGLMALAGGVAPIAVKKAFKKFKGVCHRLETVATVKGIKFINDSKATNVASTLTALKALQAEGRKIWLIMGGLDKGGSYKVLATFLKKSVKYILTVGLASKKIHGQLKGICRVINAVTIKKASDFCFENARRGDICLLSPSCSSFDQFENFEQRGEHFKKIVKGFIGR